MAHAKYAKLNVNGDGLMTIKYLSTNRCFVEILVIEIINNVRQSTSLEILAVPMQEIYLIACLKSSITTPVTFIKLRRRIFNYIVEITAFLFVTRGSLIKKIIISLRTITIQLSQH
ncbi:unnamed protein product [Porites evermanni]|uniref:Uncharacterized protein n=1 Tax=Porites evermanni TaxID=104178 RepID=A0ABN8Q2U2_9CNID|nr:unnamed protein product [Porites evermanni]